MPASFSCPGLPGWLGQYAQVGWPRPVAFGPVVSPSLHHSHPVDRTRRGVQGPPDPSPRRRPYYVYRCGDAERVRPSWIGPPAGPARQRRGRAGRPRRRPSGWRRPGLAPQEEAPGKAPALPGACRRPRNTAGIAARWLPARPWPRSRTGGRSRGNTGGPWSGDSLRAASGPR